MGLCIHRTTTTNLWANTSSINFRHFPTNKACPGNGVAIDSLGTQDPWFSNCGGHQNHPEVVKTQHCWVPLLGFLTQEVWGEAWECAFPSPSQVMLIKPQRSTGLGPCGPWTSSISISWKRVRNAHFQAPLLTCFIGKTVEELVQKSVFQQAPQRFWCTLPKQMSNGANLSSRRLKIIGWKQLARSY